MKIHSKLLALCFVQANVWGGTAFTVKAPTTAFPVRASGASSVVLRSSDLSKADEAPSDVLQRTPLIPLEPIQGGGTVRTWKMPPGITQAQYEIRTYGRPMKCMVQMWIGPLRNVHTMEMDCMNGATTPYRGTLKFKPGVDPTIKISTSADLQLPVLGGVYIPTQEESKALLADTEKVWTSTLPGQKQMLQGGSTEGGLGAVRTFNIPDTTDAVQMVIWAKDTSKKSFKAKIEVLQGPNNKKQSFDIQCGGGTQPYHGVIETPGSGWIIRMQNKKYVEDGLFEVAIVPYSGLADSKATAAGEKPWYA